MSHAPRSPIIYAADADIRFGDLDPYGHLNAKHYLDIVASTRLIFLDRELHVPIEQIMEQGIGFYLRSAQQNFRRPITKVGRVHVRSWVAKVSGASLTVPYEILTESREHVYADGSLQYVIVALATQKPVKCPAWLIDLFLTKPV